ncbi:MAG: hypothetical protein Q7V04_03190 [Deltaproteobacteria bacterium]|nr:hypothetical protein [Deltaproteobacteria bacterium]
MANVRSKWTNNTVAPGTMLPASEWGDAAMMTIPAGYMMVKNDADNLYIILDVVGDNGNDPGTNDYYWLVIDSDNDGAVTTDRDVLYSPWPGQPNRLGRWVMARPNATWPAPNSQVIDSSTRMSFGPTSHSPLNHRIWEIRLSLSEMGITLDPTGPAPVVRFGLRIASSTPSFIYEYPVNPLSAFSSFHKIILANSAPAIYPAGTAGVVIGGVGIIPATKINAAGYATISEPYRINPDAAAFGGTLDLIGNTATLPGLWAAGARKYRVLHRCGNTVAEVNAAPWTPIRQNWANYRWTGTTHVWESFGPDSNHLYPLVNPALDYSIKALLFQWNSATEPNNIHQFKIDFYRTAAIPVASPPQILTLRLDNKLPEVKLIDALHNGLPVAPCAIENMADSNDGVQLAFKAFDPEGDLYNYTLSAEWGAGQSEVISTDSYANPANRTTAPVWHGISSATMPASPGKWVPPVTCAYLFRISAWARVTNGYYYPYGWVTDFRTLTLVKPGVKLTVKPKLPVVEMIPYGFDTKGKIVGKGIEPNKLGRETLAK